MKAELIVFPYKNIRLTVAEKKLLLKFSKQFIITVVAQQLT